MNLTIRSTSSFLIGTFNNSFSLAFFSAASLLRRSPIILNAFNKNDYD